MLGLVELVTGRATLESFEAWIALPHVAKRFGFTSETVPMLGTWLRAAGYRYGLSDAHLRNLDPVTHANVRDMTLSRAVERLVMGFALPASEGDPLFDTLPVRGTEEDGWKDVSEEPGLLDAVSRLAASLEGFRLRTEKAAAPEAWTTWLADATAVFFRDDEGGAFNRIRNAAATLREEIERAGVTEIPFGIFMKSLELAQETSPGGGMPTPRVTFTGMSQLRPLPYKIIAVVGLNEDCAFPGNPHRQEFDLMAHAAAAGTATAAATTATSSSTSCSPREGRSSSRTSAERVRVRPSASHPWSRRSFENGCSPLRRAAPNAAAQRRSSPSTCRSTPIRPRASAMRAGAGEAMIPLFSRRSGRPCRRLRRDRAEVRRYWPRGLQAHRSLGARDLRLLEGACQEDAGCGRRQASGRGRRRRARHDAAR